MRGAKTLSSTSIYYKALPLDAKRTAWLNSQGYTVIRFWNNEVMENIEGVVITIQNSLSKPK